MVSLILTVTCRRNYDATGNWGQRQGSFRRMVFLEEAHGKRLGGSSVRVPSVQLITHMSGVSVIACLQVSAFIGTGNYECAGRWQLFT